MFSMVLRVHCTQCMRDVHQSQTIFDQIYSEEVTYVIYQTQFEACGVIMFASPTIFSKMII